MNKKLGQWLKIIACLIILPAHFESKASAIDAAPETDAITRSIRKIINHTGNDAIKIVNALFCKIYNIEVNFNDNEQYRASNWKIHDDILLNFILKGKVDVEGHLLKDMGISPIMATEQEREMLSKAIILCAVLT